MCEAVVLPVNPLKLTLTIIVCATGSIVTTAKPVPREAFGGTSFEPLSVVVKTIGAAVATPESIKKVKTRTRRLSVLLIRNLHLVERLCRAVRDYGEHVREMTIFDCVSRGVRTPGVMEESF
jgi:hypothetical protein